MRNRLCVLLAMLGLASGAWAQPAPESPQAIFDQAQQAFREGRIGESAAAFDRLVELVPGAVPQLWQRGIVLYYARRYGDCRRQFEAHRTVNPNDVENAAWHFLCVARAASPEAARAALLPVGSDTRVPMREIYRLLEGTAAPEDVLAAAGSSTSGQFYAHLYLGLYFEALGEPDRAREHIAAAADDRFASAGGYMHLVARIHLARTMPPEE